MTNLNELSDSEKRDWINEAMRWRSNPTEFMARHYEWISQPDAVRPQQAADGTWDIVLRIDSGYTREDAVAIAETHQHDIDDIVYDLQTVCVYVLESWRGTRR